MDRNGTFGLIEKYAVIAYTEPPQSLELAAEGFDSAFPRLGITVDRFQNPQRGWLVDQANLTRNIRLKTDSLHMDLRAYSLRI
jgi:hypothetical protein